MKKRKLTAIITSLALLLSAGMSATPASAADSDTTASSGSQAVRYCEHCGAELPEGTLSTPLGIWLCDNCRAQGMGGTTTPTSTTGTTTAVGGTDVVIQPEEQHLFSFSIMDENNDPVRTSEIKLLIMYEDNSVDVLNYSGLPCWIDKHGMGGRIVISDAPEQYRITDESSADFPEDGGNVVLRLENNPDCTTAASYGTDTCVTTCTTTTCPIEDEELGVYVYDEDNSLVGGVTVEFYYDDYSSETFTTVSGVPLIHKHDGRMGTITLTSLPEGYELIPGSPKEFNFIETSTFAKFYLRRNDVSTTAATSTTTTVSTAPQTTSTSVDDSLDTTTQVTAPVASFTIPESATLLPKGSMMECPFSSFMVSWVEFSADSPLITFEEPRMELKNGESGKFVLRTADDAGECDVIITATYNNWLTNEISTTEMVLYLRETSTGEDAVKRIALTGETVYGIDDSGIILSGAGKFLLGSNIAKQTLTALEAGTKINVVLFYTVRNDGTNVISNASDLSCTAYPEDMEELAPVLSGDANCDGEVNMADAVLIMQAVTNPDKYGIGRTRGINLLGAANADIDGGGVTQKDALKIQQYKLGIAGLDK